MIDDESSAKSEIVLPVYLKITDIDQENAPECSQYIAFLDVLKRLLNLPS